MRSLIPPTYLLTRPAARRRSQWTRRAGLTAGALLLAFTAGARAASVFYIRGGGDGHGIGMSQYGAYGYALQGADYRFILAHYCQGTALQTTNPQRIVRVLLATGAASFSGATTVSGSPATRPYHSWGSQMSAAAATARLGSLVKGALLGIQVTRHGVSPRIVKAQVVGTGGRSTVTGTQLQSIFGLDSTYAAFSTISAQDAMGRLRGTIFPAPGHGSVSVQVNRAGGWRTVAQAPISAAGGYSAIVAAGRYRIADGSLDGPVVTVP